jgi:cell shape-determining protein MreC
MAKHGKPALSRGDLIFQRDAALAEFDKARQALHTKCSELEAKTTELEARNKKYQKLDEQCQQLTDENKRLRARLDSVSYVATEGV